MNITIFTKNSGKIKRLISCPEYMAESQCGDGEGFLVEWYDSILYYIHNGEATLCPTQETTLSHTFALANGIDEVVLQYLPIPCTVTVANAVYEVDDGTLEISFDTPGEYQVTVTSFPYLDKTFTVEAI